MKIAESVTIEWDTGGITIDGAQFPYYVGEDVQVDPGGGAELTVVHLPLIVDGFVLLASPGRRIVVDGAIGAGLGDVGAWARDFIRTGMTEAFPWLDLAKEEA